MTAIPAMPVELFETFNDWQPNFLGWQPVSDDVLVKVRYSNGFVSTYVRCAKAWRTWTGGRDWWQKPADDRLYIAEYVVIG
jgi:hypothetical protein